MEIRLWVEQGQVFEVEQGWAFELGKLAFRLKNDRVFEAGKKIEP
ncbi:hypothetical protein [Bartonella henselae]|nr:hypothetical protein [Bartonella henselae]